MDLLTKLLVTVFLGLVLGIERDSNWQKRPVTSMPKFTFMRTGPLAKGLGGIRTYVLLALLGFVCGMAYAASSSLVFLGIVAFIALLFLVSIAYFLHYFDENTLGLTSELSLFVLFALSFLLGSGLVDPRIVLTIGAFISLVLSLKLEFHRIVAAFTKKEILESVEFALLIGVIYPWLPNVDIKLAPLLHVLNINVPLLNDVVFVNPQKLWIVVIFVTSLNFVGYFLAKLLKSSRSTLVTGFLGGLISSTTVTQLMAMKSRDVKDDHSTQNLLVATALIANATSFFRMPLLAFILNKQLFGAIWISMLFMLVASICITLLSLKKDIVLENEPVIFKSPLALPPALEFAGLFLLVQVATQIGIIYLGNAGFAVSTLIAAAAGLDAITINTARSIPSLITLQFGSIVLLGAVVANLVFKLGLASVVGTKYFNRRLLIVFAGIILAGLVGLVFAFF